MKQINTNDDAQISLDFLIGITIFMLALLFVLTFIPKMFTPYQSNSDELTMAADKAAAVMVENILIDDQHIDSSSGTIVVTNSEYNPGLITYDKYDQLKDDLSADAVEVKKKLGLGYGKNDYLYDLEIILSTPDDSTDSLFNTPIYSDSPMSGTNVGQSKRFVYIVKNDVGVPFYYYKAILTVRVW